MSSGHLDERVTMMPFWIESSSRGRPSRDQSPMVDSSTMNSVTDMPSDTGIFFSTQSL